VSTGVSLRRLAATLAALATTAGGLTAFAGPAGAATGPTARLQHGTATITGTPARDVIDITEDASQLSIDFGFDGTIDAQFPMSRVRQISVLAGDGDDGVTLTGSGVGDVPVTIDTGGGNDGGGVVGNIGDFGVGDAPVTLLGGDGNDNFVAAVPGPITVDAGAGDDRIDGGGAGVGQESISLGDGNDRFISELNAFVGFRSDTVDGGAGRDSLQMNGTFASEGLNLAADAGHLIVTHDFANVDSDNIEDVAWFGFGGLDEGNGGDQITVNDLSGTDVATFTPNFSHPNDPTLPNNSSDQLRVVGTAGVDHYTVTGSGANITITGQTPTINAVLLDSADVLRFDTLDGNDTVDTTGLQPNLVQLQVF
jgi:hypothetical protein